MFPTTVICMATTDYVANWLFCINSQQEYCRIHGYDYDLASEPVDGLNAKWSKLVYARDQLAAGCNVLMIDADCWISPQTPPLESLLSTAEDRDIFVCLGLSGRPNSGFMLFRGGDTAALTFLQTCLDARLTPIPPEDRVTVEGENGHVIAILKRPPFAARTQILDRAWNCSLPEEAETAFVRHYTNKLREHLRSGEGMNELALSFPCRTNEQGEKRAAYRLFRNVLPALRQRLHSEPGALDEFRALTTQAGADCGVTFPRLPIDDADAWLWRYQFATGLLERPSIELLVNLARAGGQCLDAGAHVGYYARALEATGCKVLAVEAHPENLAALRANTGANTAIAHAALANFNGKAQLHDGHGHSNSSLVAGGPATARTFSVPARTIDSLCAEAGIDRLDLLKIDIEGMEPDALLGAREILSRSEDIVILCEVNPHLLGLRGMKAEDFMSFLFDMGFVGAAVSDDFGLAPFGATHRTRTMNYIISRPAHWERIYRIFQ